MSEGWRSYREQTENGSFQNQMECPVWRGLPRGASKEVLPLWEGLKQKVLQGETPKLRGNRYTQIELIGDESNSKDCIWFLRN